MITRQEIYDKVKSFIIEHKDAPTAWRPELVRTLTDELAAAGCDRSRYWSLTMRHPALLRKSAKQFSIGDILADYIMNIDEVAERSAEYPVHGPEREYRDANRREAYESLLRTDRGEDYEPGTVYEDAFNSGNPVESVLFDAAPNMTAEELRGELASIQRSPADFVQRYADGGDWNRRDSEKKRTPANVLDAIQALDLRRVKACIVCGNAFYSHSPQPGRVKVCDIMPHPQQKGKFVCQVTRDNALALLRKRAA
ncbi:hypothetical protein [Paenibacillus apii]|uniref:hypothetical protein n=1 Tax=Paenibacillus apii TaxID=1850370 RepID=UPI001439D41F|nr:hypothetical protein [Paenibacillus apii]NJJ38402.1 hypothetical protein [Paenibacillus apii]